MKFINPQALSSALILFVHYSLGFGFINFTDTVVPVSNYYINTSTEALHTIIVQSLLDNNGDKCILLL